MGVEIVIGGVLEVCVEGVGDVGVLKFDVFMILFVVFLIWIVVFFLGFIKLVVVGFGWVF